MFNVVSHHEHIGIGGTRYCCRCGQSRAADSLFPPLPYPVVKLPVPVDAVEFSTRPVIGGQQVPVTGVRLIACRVAS